MILGILVYFIVLVGCVGISIRALYKAWEKEDQKNTEEERTKSSGR